MVRCPAGDQSRKHKTHTRCEEAWTTTHGEDRATAPFSDALALMLAQPVTLAPSPPHSDQRLDRAINPHEHDHHQKERTVITNSAVASQMADQRRADRLREAHYARLAREALRRHRTARRDSMPGVRLRSGAARIAAAR
jgi:hypothetical protein